MFNMELIRRLLIFILGFTTIIIFHLFPKRFFSIGIISGLVAGLLFGLEHNSMDHNNLLFGLSVGIIFTLIMLTSGLLTQYYSSRGKNS